MPISAPAAIAVILAVVLAAGLSARAARSFRRQGPGAVATWWGALAVGLAYVLTHLGVATPSFPPLDVTDRIPFVALAGTIVAAVLVGNQDVRWARVAGYIGLAVLAYGAMLEPVLMAGEYPRETILWLSATAVASLFFGLNVGLLDTPTRRPELWAGLTVFAAGAGVVLVLSNSAVLFQLGGILALVLAASLLGAWGMPVGGGVPVASTVLTALVIEGYVYASLPTTGALLLAGAPASLWLTRLGPLARLGPKSRSVAAAGLIFIPVVVAAVLVWSSKPSEVY